MNDNLIFELLSKRTVAYRVEFAHLYGGVKAGLFLSQLFYWSQRSVDGWVFRTQQQLFDEMGMTRYEQEGARKLLRKHGAISEKKMGNRGQLFYRLNMKTIAEDLRRFYSENPRWGKPASGTAENQHLEMGKNDFLSYKENKQRIYREAPTNENYDQMIDDIFNEK